MFTLGLLLVLLGAALAAAEAHVPSYGALGTGAVVAFATGVGYAMPHGAALLRLLADPPLRARMATAAIARDRSVFSRARQVGAWAALIDEVATTPGPPAAAG